MFSVLLVMLVPLAGCASPVVTTAPSSTSAASTSKSESTAQKKLTVWVLKSFSETANNSFIARLNQFGKEKNVIMETELVAQDAYNTKLLPAIESKQTPDLIYLSTNYLQSLYPNIPYIDLSDFIKEIDNSQKINSFLLPLTELEGKQYFLPSFISGSGFYYRKDYLKKAGIENPPKTWDEFAIACKAVSNPEKKLYGYAGGCGPKDDDGECDIRDMIAGMGGGLYDKDGNINVLAPETIKGVQLYVDLYKNKYIPPSALTWDGAGNNTSYLSGESAMVFNSFTLVGALKAARNETVLANTRYAPYPAGPSGTHIFGGGPWGYGIFQNSKEQALAKELLKYLIEPDWYNSWFASMAPVFGPTFVASANVPLWQDPINKLMFDNTKYARIWAYPATDIKTAIKATKGFSQYLLTQLVVKIILIGMTVEAGMKELKTQMESIK